ncbi:hypothetical protein IBE52_10080 [Francisella philomiragia]|uniref:Uncharacterized protein n=2 Tax=Francisella philomiragia TaxID=28110 RepID=A0ABS1GEN6_9GAMM|nr:hypothetical protein [Francisella philomiragia]MBK2303262.1 hypothetical protein [Francisella philomiragia]
MYHVLIRTKEFTCVSNKLFRYKTYNTNTITLWIFALLAFIFFVLFNRYLGIDLNKNTLCVVLTCLSILFGFYMTCISLFAGSNFIKTLNNEDKEVKSFKQRKVHSLIGIVSRGFGNIFISLFICFILLLMPKSIYNCIINFYFVKAVVLSVIVSNLVDTRFFIQIMYNCFISEAKS